MPLKMSEWQDLQLYQTFWKLLLRAEMDNDFMVAREAHPHLRTADREHY
jgi:hypothetical protein